MKKHPYTGVMLLGDFNNLNDTQLRSYPLKQVVRMSTRRSAILHMYIGRSICSRPNAIFLNLLYEMPIQLYYR